MGIFLKGIFRPGGDDVEVDVSEIGSGPIIRGPFSFSFDTPGLESGLEFYTPTIGDFLLDAWWEIDTYWDSGSAVSGDIGFLGFDNAGAGEGLFAYAYGSDKNKVDVSQQAFSGPGSSLSGKMIRGGANLAGVSMVGQAFDMLAVAGQDDVPFSQDALIRHDTLSAFPAVPLLFVDDTPLVVCVSQTGETTGDAPTGTTQGEARIYIMTATPVPLV